MISPKKLMNITGELGTVLGSINGLLEEQNELMKSVLTELKMMNKNDDTSTIKENDINNS